MSPRHRRLVADMADLDALAQQQPLFYTASGDPPDRYQVRIDVNGLERDSRGQVHIRDNHEFGIYLPIDYPRKPPAIAWQTPIFHPNILGPDRNGAVCLGSWAPGEGLADLCRRLMRMVTYEMFNVEDALNTEAGEWVRERGLEPGTEALDAVSLAA